MALRQAGVPAAAGLYALRHHVERLRDDHGNAAELPDALKRQGILIGSGHPLRLVTHLDIQRDDVQTFVAAVHSTLARA